MENAFNPQEFSALLKKLIGSRKVLDFAAESGLSKYQLSRRLTGSLDTPPTQRTLKKMASYAQNGVTYEQLLSCCGYNHTSSQQAMNEKESKVARACLLSSLNDLNISVQLSKEAPMTDCDFELVIGNNPQITWDFFCLPANTTVPAVEQTLCDRFQSLMYCRLKSYAKFSFLTGSKEMFSTCLKKPPVNLNVNVSVLLYAPDDLEILDEKIICSSRNEPFPIGYSFPERSPLKEK